MTKPAPDISLMVSLAEQDQEVCLRATADGNALTSAERDAMLRAVQSRAPHAPLRLYFDAVTFIQPEGKPNAKFARLKPSAMAAFAATAPGTPFLKDHNGYDLESRGGKVTATRVGQRNGSPALIQTFEVVKPWALEGVLDGTIDRFSISWSAKGATCSICNGQMYGRDSRCLHWPGQSYSMPGGVEQVCEMLYSDVTAKETSAVNIPAVADTEIESVRAALSAARSTPEKGAPMFEKIRAALGTALTGDVDEERLAAEVATQKRALTEATAMLAAERQATTVVRAELEVARAELKKLSDAQGQGKIDALVERALAEGRIIAGRGPAGEKLDADKKPFVGEGERAIRLLAETSLEAAERWVKSLPRTVPIPRADGKSPSVRPPTGAAQLSATQRKINAQMGISDEMFLKFAPKPEAEAPDDEDDEEVA